MTQALITESSLLLGGIPVFTGTRVPVHALWEYLAAGESLDAFLSDFPTVSRQTALMLLQQAEASLLHAHPH